MEQFDIITIIEFWNNLKGTTSHQFRENSKTYKRIHSFLTALLKGMPIYPKSQKTLDKCHGNLINYANKNNIPLAILTRKWSKEEIMGVLKQIANEHFRKYGKTKKLQLDMIIWNPFVHTKNSTHKTILIGDSRFLRYALDFLKENAIEKAKPKLPHIYRERSINPFCHNIITAFINTLTIKPTNETKISWAIELEKFIKNTGMSKQQIKNLMTWYCENMNSEKYPYSHSTTIFHFLNMIESIQFAKQMNEYTENQYTKYKRQVHLLREFKNEQEYKLEILSEKINKIDNQLKDDEKSLKWNFSNIFFISSMIILFLYIINKFIL